MARQFPAIEATHRRFIEAQKLFFVASAAPGARVNLSPKGMDSLRLLGPNAVAYLDRTGSGNETAAHLKADGRLTLMFCAFEGAPLILRLYGTGHVLKRGSADYGAFLAEHFGGREPLGARQVVMQRIDLVQTSCGYAIPFFDYTGERPALDLWAEKKGEAGLDAYRREKNSASIDGLPTGMFD
jgi:hypothetical protein